jgi:hypothetical protein
VQRVLKYLHVDGHLRSRARLASADRKTEDGLYLVGGRKGADEHEWHAAECEQTGRGRLANARVADSDELVKELRAVEDVSRQFRLLFITSREQLKRGEAARRPRRGKGRVHELLKVYTETRLQVRHRKKEETKNVRRASRERWKGLRPQVGVHRLC